MEEYLQYMKTLRCQMNGSFSLFRVKSHAFPPIKLLISEFDFYVAGSKDVEDQAAKVSFEEQSLITGIQALEDDISSGFTSFYYNASRCDCGV